MLKILIACLRANNTFSVIIYHHFVTDTVSNNVQWMVDIFIIKMKNWKLKVKEDSALTVSVCHVLFSCVGLFSYCTAWLGFFIDSSHFFVLFYELNKAWKLSLFIHLQHIWYKDRRAHSATLWRKRRITPSWWSFPSLLALLATVLNGGAWLQLILYSNKEKNPHVIFMKNYRFSLSFQGGCKNDLEKKNYFNFIGGKNYSFMHHLFQYKVITVNWTKLKRF